MSAQAEYLNVPNQRNQYISAIAANLVFLSHGCMVGWYAPATPILLSRETPLITGPLTNDQVSWIGSISTIGSIISSFTFGFITSFFGCKRTIMFMALPLILVYVLIYIGDTYNYVLFARFVIGWCAGGIQTSVIIYITDIANNSIRGKLSSFSYAARNIGILIAYILGPLLPYKIVPCVYVTVPIVFVIWFAFFPNTPQFHLKQGNFQKAESALRYYKGLKENTAAECDEFKAEFARLKLIANEQKINEKFHLNDFLNRSALLGLLNGIVLACLAYLTGFMVFITYAVIIFEESGAQIDANISIIIFAVLQIIGNLCTTTLCDSLGRKSLLIVSLTGSAIGLYAFALFCYLRHTGYEVSAFMEWIPVISLSFVIFTASAGVVPLMFLNMAEQLPSKIRTVGLTICNMAMMIVSFLSLKFFPTLMVSIGLYGSMLIFAIPCTFGTLYVYFVIKETKGISLDAQEKNQN